MLTNQYSGTIRPLVIKCERDAGECQPNLFYGCFSYISLIAEYPHTSS
jgi:hypothetical protein